MFRIFVISGLVFSAIPAKEVVKVQLPPAAELGSKTVLVDYSYLKNPAVGSLVGAYVGHYGRLPDRKYVNFSDNLNKLWQKKLAIENVTPATIETASKITYRYHRSSKEKKSVGRFISEIDNIAATSNRAINFAALCKKLKVDRDKCEDYRDVAGSIRGPNIAAYGMTELFPSKSGDFNYILLDTLLRNAGENYLMSIPALGDKYLSFGFYQFTSFAVRHDAEHVEGANVVSMYSSKKIAGSVASLSTEEHHRAASYFATYNIGRLFKRLNDKQVRYIREGRCDDSEWTQFVAVAHHNPKFAIKNADKWIQEGCSKPLVTYLGPRLKAYAIKTKNNLKVLEKHLT